MSTSSALDRATPTVAEPAAPAAVAPSRPGASSGPAASDLSYRAWFWSFVAVFATVAALIVGRVIPAQYASLAGYFLYMALACTFVPLNTLWIVLWLATQFPAWLVALVGAVGTSLANLNDYYLLSFLFEFDRVKRLRERRGYQRAVAWFDRAPLLTLTTFSFLPIPVDVVRLLAISRRYSQARFTAASFLGRFPRYYLLARGWQWLGLPNWSLLVVVAGVAGLFLLRQVRWGKLWGRAQPAKEPAPAAVAETEVPRE